MPTSQTKPNTVGLALIVLGALIACSSNQLGVTVFGVALLAIGAIMLRWG